MSPAPSGFEIREHTADVAVYAWGDTPAALFNAAADGFYEVMGELVATGEAEPHQIRLAGGDLSDLLCDYLSELLFLFETRQARVEDCSFKELEDGLLHATCRLNRIDMDSSSFDAGIKAVTRHEAEIARTPDGYEVTVILDL